MRREGGPNEPSIQLSQKILEMMVEFESNPVNIALDFLKKETKEILQ
jgi:hypothetical protein